LASFAIELAIVPATGLTLRCAGDNILPGGLIMEKRSGIAALAAVLFVLLPLVGDKVYVNSKASKADLKKAGGTVSHELWGKVLARRLGEKGLFDYQGLKKDKDGLKDLDAYLDMLGAVDPDRLKSKEEKLAFWINCYNAAAVAGVIKFYPIKSIKDVKDFWHRITVHVGDKEYSLGDIENSILRGFGEPRIHWALVRASKGCARLLDQPYGAEKLDEQLTNREKKYLTGRKQVYIDKEKKLLMLSSLFFWYGEDFIKAAGTKLDYVRKYLSEEDLEFLEDNPVGTAYIKYDWSLNEQEQEK
jgi:hypothetical protein